MAPVSWEIMNAHDFVFCIKGLWYWEVYMENNRPVSQNRKMGKSHFMSMEDHVLDQRMLVRTSLGGMLLVLTSNNSVTKANNTFTCERNFAATVKFSLSLSLRPSIPYGCNFTGEKKKKISRKWIEQTSNEFSEIS